MRGATCERLADFGDTDERRRWRVVNDDVMGGRSLGGVALEEGAMLFSGDIDTNGGGFSSIRRPLEPGRLAGVDDIVLRVATDGKPYRLTVGSATRRRVFYRERIEFETTDAWQSVSVPLASLRPSVFGELVAGGPLDPGDAANIGLILNDVGDGPFALRIAWIDLCRRD